MPDNKKTIEQAKSDLRALLAKIAGSHEIDDLVDSIEMVAMDYARELLEEKFPVTKIADGLMKRTEELVTQKTNEFLQSIKAPAAPAVAVYTDAPKVA